jgi:hypothetical protein
MENRPHIGLDSNDRLFPNQDTLPQGGLANLIALPLQRGPRDQGNSAFIDDELVPWSWSIDVNSSINGSSDSRPSSTSRRNQSVVWAAPGRERRDWSMSL